MTQDTKNNNEEKKEPHLMDEGTSTELTPEISEAEKLLAQNQELNEKFLRLYAEFDNYKRRTAKERIELMQTAGKDVIVSLLPVIDDFERALKAVETFKDIQALKEGVDLIYNKLKTILESKGLKQIEAVGKDFDTDLHEAITRIPAGDKMKDKVVDELEKGYLLQDKVIRFTKVVVGE